jgi:serine phosphatase RsbU (regulator of sigma subunit)
VISAGHPPPILIGDTIAPVDVRPGPPLGVAISDHPWRPTQIELPRGFALLLYTDGVVEGRAAPDSSERLGIEPLMDVLRDHAAGPDELLRELMTVALEANGAPLADDAALVLINEGSRLRSAAPHLAGAGARTPADTAEADPGDGTSAGIAAPGRG